MAGQGSHVIVAINNDPNRVAICGSVQVREGLQWKARAIAPLNYKTITAACNGKPDPNRRSGGLGARPSYFKISYTICIKTINFIKWHQAQYKKSALNISGKNI